MNSNVKDIYLLMLKKQFYRDIDQMIPRYCRIKNCLSVVKDMLQYMSLKPSYRLLPIKLLDKGGCDFMVVIAFYLEAG